MGLIPRRGRRLSVAALGSLLLAGFLSVAVTAGGQRAAASSGPAQDNVLQSVSCSGPTSCMAVGYEDNDAYVSQNLTESYDGTHWSVVASPDVVSADGWTIGNQLYGVSCVKASYCVAVGYSQGSSGAAQTVALLWNGKHWTLMTTPDEGTGDNILASVDCTSASNCVAVGSTDTLADSLVETWNGTAWTMIPSPTPAGDGAYLAGVSCVDASSCMAVGNASTGGNSYVALAEVWDGTSWSVTPTPTVGTGSDFLYGVSCTSADACVAVGVADPPDVGENWSMLSESWDGTSWSVIPGYGTNQIGNGVSCTDATTCEEGGQYYDGDNYLASALGLTSGGWSDTDSQDNPNPATHDNEFYGMSCASAGMCVAVGFYSGDIDQTLIETMDANGKWSIASSPDVTGAPAPTIKKTSRAGRVGQKLTIVGADLEGATQVTVNGTPVSQIVVDKPGRIVALVPAGATSGYVQVTTGGGSATSKKIYKVKQ